jgi:two-component system response regulator HupR/HoxA
MKPAPTPLPRQVVLLVDDEAEIRDVMILGLKDHFEVETAASTAEAEMMLGTRSYDAVVCDHLMPDEEGLPFLTRARKQFPQVQRILITGYINPELLSRSTEVAGLAGVLMKPVNMVDLIQAIRLAVPR